MQHVQHQSAAARGAHDGGGRGDVLHGRKAVEFEPRDDAVAGRGRGECGETLRRRRQIRDIVDMDGGARGAERGPDAQPLLEPGEVSVAVERENFQVADRDTGPGEGVTKRRDVIARNAGVEAPRLVRHMGEKRDMIAAQPPRDRRQIGR